MPSPYRVVDNATGMLVSEGEVLTSFRNETATLVSADAAQTEGKSGKVTVRFPDGSLGWHYDKVWDVTVLTEEDWQAQQRLNRFIDAQ